MKILMEKKVNIRSFFSSFFFQCNRLGTPYLGRMIAMILFTSGWITAIFIYIHPQIQGSFIHILRNDGLLIILKDPYWARALFFKIIEIFLWAGLIILHGNYGADLVRSSVTQTNVKEQYRLWMSLDGMGFLGRFLAVFSMTILFWTGGLTLSSQISSFFPQIQWKILLYYGALVWTFITLFLFARLCPYMISIAVKDPRNPGKIWDHSHPHRWAFLIFVIGFFIITWFLLSIFSIIMPTLVGKWYSIRVTLKVAVGVFWETFFWMGLGIIYGHRLHRPSLDS
jgi:hypothetical protein